MHCGVTTPAVRRGIEAWQSLAPCGRDASQSADGGAPIVVIDIEGVVLAQPFERHQNSLWRALRTDDGQLVRVIMRNMANSPAG